MFYGVMTVVDKVRVELLFRSALVCAGGGFF